MPIPTHRRLVPLLALLLLPASQGPGTVTTGDRVAAASRLPELASDLRDAGYAPDDVARALATMRAHQVPVKDAAGVLSIAWKARREAPTSRVASLDARIERLFALGVAPSALADSLAPAAASQRPPKEVR